MIKYTLSTNSEHHIIDCEIPIYIYPESIYIENRFKFIKNMDYLFTTINKSFDLTKDQYSRQFYIPSIYKEKLRSEISSKYLIKKKMIRLNTSHIVDMESVDKNRYLIIDNICIVMVDKYYNRWHIKHRNILINQILS